jgi:hypothetical protein
VPPAVVLSDILHWVEKAIGTLPEEMAELWQVACKILKRFLQTKQPHVWREGSLDLESQ